MSTTTESSRLALWKSNLVERAVADPLLDAATEHVGIAFAVDAVALANVLATGASFRIEPGAACDLETGRLRTPMIASALVGRLRRIARAAKTARAATGEAVVWLALGELSWIDITGVSHPAPLALWPVELIARDGDFEVVPLAREPRGNAVLAARLHREFDFEMPATFELTAWSDAAASFALTRPGWGVRRAVSLGVFALDRETIARDVADIELAAHPLLERLATRATTPKMTLPPASATDVVAPLDADASQLAAIAAAGEGASFVLVGPPGTGKSQTIANLVAHCATQGKSVLVVSDKPAAREVIQARLAAVGLGELCLPLDAGRAAVVTQLGRVLDRAFRPGSGPNGVDPRLGELRGALDRHAVALHHAGPFGRPLHEVIGRLVELRTTPNAALAERDATGLDRGSFDRRKLAVEALARAAVPVEPVGTHPWRASLLERWPLAADDHEDRRRRTLATLAEARLAAEELADAAREVVALVPGLVAQSADQLGALGTLAAIAATSPRPGAELLTQLRSTRGDELGERVALIRARGTGTVEVPRDPAAFLAVAARHRTLALEVDDRFTDAVDQLDVGALWAQLKKWTASVAPLRYVALRTVRAEVRSAALPGELHSDQAMIDALEGAIAERACRAALTAAAEPARRWFGELGGDPLVLDLSKVDAAVGWAGELRKAFDVAEVPEPLRANAWRALVAQVASTPTAGDDLGVFARAADAVHRWQLAVVALAETTGIPVAALGPTPAAYPDHLANLTEQATYLEQAIDQLRDWVGFHAARRDARAAGVGPAIAAIEGGDLGAAELAPAWERATLLAWGDAELADQADLASFHGAAHHAAVAAYADLDRAAVALARTRAIARLADRVPARRGSSDPEVAVLVEALACNTRALVDPAAPVVALRDLFAQMPSLLGKLAPCLIASPLAVARDLDRALPRFDVVVFDEASQLPVAHALGAIARAGALVVCGDPRQLAPADGSESLLAACQAAQLPELALATHYRSRHEDLFATANRLAYGDRLAAFPVAQGSSELGVTWKRVDAIYDRATGQNRAEAEAVVAEVCARLRDPVQRTRTLAVATFATAQRDLISELLDAACTADCAIDGGFEIAAEAVLVETVDTLQGHERDVVIVAIGYGSDADGHLGTSFGTLAEPDGERAAVVAFTRAREQLVIVSSFAPEDLPVDAPLGVRHVAETIAFARAGGGASRGDDVPASPITAAIARALGERGWSVRHQVGCGAYKLDLAVVDPNDPERYVLAIEHDGRAYAGAPAARDRDRLRAQVLASLGWRLHRIWTLDWWGDTERELQRAHGAIVSSIAASRTRRAPTPVTTRARSASGRHVASAPAVVKIPPKASDLTLPTSVPELAPELITLATGSGPQELVDAASAPIRVKRGSIAIGPYSAALIPAGRRAPDDMFAPRHVAELGKVVEQVLAAEAPMHLQLLARRVGAYFGIGRLSQRVTDQVKHALLGRARWGGEDGIVWRLDQDPTMVPAVRVAGQGAEARRGIDEVPLAELASAARIVVERAGGIAATDLVRDTARLLGFARITPDVTARIDIGVRLATQRELIKLDDGRASIPS